MLTRKRSTLLRGSKRGRGDDDGVEEDERGLCEYRCSHLSMIAAMRREIAELKGALERECAKETERNEALRIRADAQQRDRDTVERRLSMHTQPREEALNRMSYELDVCRRDLEDAKQALDQALDDRDVLEGKLSQSVASAKKRSGLGGVDGLSRCHPHLDWVGRHYLAVSLPEDRMFRPGHPVTPVGVLQKLFEMRVGEKQSTGFSILLENVNIAFCQAEPEWYAQHFGFTKPRIHGNGYRSAEKVDTEDFAWLLFEYGAQAPFIEVLAGLLNVLSSTGKGGITTIALQLSKSLYAAGVTLFRETVSRASSAFVGVHERARRVRETLGLVSVPITSGLLEEHSVSRRDLSEGRNGVLRSVLEGIEAPTRQARPCSKHESENRTLDKGLLNIDRSLSAFITRRGLEERSGGNVGARPSGDPGKFCPLGQIGSTAHQHRPAQSLVLADRVQSEPLPRSLT